METDVLIVLIIVILLVVGVNGLLVMMMRRGHGSHIRLWQRATRRARDPWRDEREKLEKLSDLVEKLKDSDPQS
jgi:hypothetical protein